MPNVIQVHLYSLAQTAASAGVSPGGGQTRSVFQLVAQATLPVKLVILLLVIFSALSWYIIGYKFIYLRRAAAETERFLKTFWETKQLNIAADVASTLPRSPVSQLFRAGYDELRKVRSEGASEGGIENIERALRRASSREMTTLESMVPFLATAGSTAPFIGLFGTVYGIMHAFEQLSSGGGQSTIDKVGPGIAEALFTTAIGLVAAIPAVMAYNYFARRIRVLSNEMDAFGNDFLNIVRRHFVK